MYVCVLFVADWLGCYSSLVAGELEVTLHYAVAGLLQRGGGNSSQPAATGWSFLTADRLWRYEPLIRVRRWNREERRSHCCVGVQVTVAAPRGAGSRPCAARPGLDYTGPDLAAATADSLALCVARCQATPV